MKDVVGQLRNLYAMRLLLEGVIADIEPQAPPDEDETGAGQGPHPESEGCQHPEAQQVDASVMGGPPLVLCLGCGLQRLGTAPGRR